MRRHRWAPFRTVLTLTCLLTILAVAILASAWGTRGLALALLVVTLNSTSKFHQPTSTLYVSGAFWQFIVLAILVVVGLAGGLSDWAVALILAGSTLLLNRLVAIAETGVDDDWAPYAHPEEHTPSRELQKEPQG